MKQLNVSLYNKKQKQHELKNKTRMWKKKKHWVYGSATLLIVASGSLVMNNQVYAEETGVSVVQTEKSEPSVTANSEKTVENPSQESTPANTANSVAPETTSSSENERISNEENKEESQEVQKQKIDTSVEQKNNEIASSTLVSDAVNETTMQQTQTDSLTTKQISQDNLKSDTSTSTTNKEESKQEKTIRSVVKTPVKDDTPENVERSNEISKEPALASKSNEQDKKIENQSDAKKIADGSSDSQQTLSSKEPSMTIDSPKSSSTTDLKDLQQSLKNTTGMIHSVLSEDTAANSTYIDKDNFLDYFTLNGSATYDPTTGIVTLTPDAYNQVGNFTLKSKIDMNQSFNLTGKINLGNKVQPNGADGFSVGFHEGNTDEIGANGGSLNFGQLEGAFGWKADTYWDSEGSGDPFKKAVFGSDPEEFKGDSNDYSGGGGRGRDFGAFVYTDDTQKAFTYDGVDAPAQAIDSPADNQFKDITIQYDGNSKILTIDYDGKFWKKDITSWKTVEAEALFFAASTGSAKNLQQFQIEAFEYFEAATIDVKYIDQSGNELAKSNASYPDGPYQGKRYTTEKKEITNYRYLKMGTDIPAEGFLNEWGNNGTVVYVYGPAYTEDKKVINETIHYVDETGKSVAPNYEATPITFITVVDPLDGHENNYYQIGEHEIPIMDQDGKISESNWVKADHATFAAIKNPKIKGYKVRSTTDSGNDLSQVTQQIVDRFSGHLDITVVYYLDDVPAIPEVPDIPIVPTIPKVPDMSTVPPVPKTPDVPTVPVIPETPIIPVKSKILKTPIKHRTQIKPIETNEPVDLIKTNKTTYFKESVEDSQKFIVKETIQTKRINTSFPKTGDDTTNLAAIIGIFFTGFSLFSGLKVKKHRNDQ